MGSCCAKIAESSNRKSKSKEDDSMKAAAAAQKTNSSSSEHVHKSTEDLQKIETKPPKKSNNNNCDGAQMKGIDGSGGIKHHRQPDSKKDLSKEHGSAGGASATTAGADDIYDKQLAIFVKETLKIGVPKLMNDFIEERIMMQPKIMPKTTAFDSNPDKNRYKNVICLDETRVILTWPSDNPNDYIHANWLNIRGEKRYICAQGPMPETTEDFWRLVFQERCEGIVMLTDITELGKIKCAQYWPKLVGESMKSGLCTIVNKKVTETEKMLISTELEITANGETFKCEHVLWTGWPDHGVPDNYLGTLRLIRKMSPFSPCLVHCSAGIGRTGTIVGLDLCQKTLQSGEKVDMHEIVKELRKFRYGSVQSDIQFVFMHAVFLKVAESRKIVTKEQLKPFFDDYAKCVAATKR